MKEIYEVVLLQDGNVLGYGSIVDVEKIYQKYKLFGKSYENMHFYKLDDYMLSRKSVMCIIQAILENKNTELGRWLDQLLSKNNLIDEAISDAMIRCENTIIDGEKKVSL